MQVPSCAYNFTLLKCIVYFHQLRLLILVSCLGYHFYPSSFINARGFVKKLCCKARDEWRSLVQPYRLMYSHCRHTCPRFFSHFVGLQVLLYVGAISDSIYFIGHICFMWLLFVFACAFYLFIKFKHKLVFLNG